MDTNELKQWALRVSGGVVQNDSDQSLSLPRDLLRFYWKSQPTVGVGSEKKDKLRINSVLNGLQWYFRRPGSVSGTLNIVLGIGRDGFQGSMREHLGAVSTLIREKSGGPEIRLWSIRSGEEPQEIVVERTEFSSHLGARKAREWNAMLMLAAADVVEGMARQLVQRVADKRLSLYPKLSSLTSARRWQVRLDGADVGRVGDHDFVFRLNTRNTDPGRQPLRGWLRAGLPVNPISGLPAPTIFGLDQLDLAVGSVRKLIDEWSGGSPDALLDNGQPEHGLEARVLSGQITLGVGGIELHPVTPCEDGSLRAAQFPTLWGDVTRPSRYLDALVADNHQRPWAIELKDHKTGGHGQYLRDGIAQAVLYRHFIRSAVELDPWFELWGLNRTECRAALAFPHALPGTESSMSDLRVLAELFGVEIIQFDRPGDPSN